MSYNKKIKITTMPLLFGAILFLLVGLPVQAVEYGGIGGRPAYPREDNPRTESIFVHTVTPSEVVEEGVKVINNTPDTKTLEVYAVDSAVSSGGAFACEQIANEQTGVGTWVTMEKHEVTLGSLTSEVVPFQINVPENASVGEHNGCIIIQEKKAKTEAGTTNGIQLSFRTGLRIALLVPGDVERNLQIVGLAMTSKDNGDWRISPSVMNTGNVSIDADVAVVASYFFGKTLHTFGGQYPILRGQTSEWNFDLVKPFWGGWYKAAMQVTYDANPEAGVGTQSGKELTVLEGPVVWFFSYPTVGALIIEIAVLLVLAVLLLLFLLKLKRCRWIRTAWVQYIVAEGDNIRSVADKHNISWKLLARANQLKPPYTLSAGEKIKVPPAG